MNRRLMKPIEDLIDYCEKQTGIKLVKVANPEVTEEQLELFPVDSPTNDY